MFAVNASQKPVRTSPASSPTVLRVTAIVEDFLCSKTGKANGGEDRLILNPSAGFYGVIDGATTKSDRKFLVGVNGELKELTGGELLANLLKAGIGERGFAPNSAELLQFVEESLCKYAKASNIDLAMPVDRPHASFAVLSERDNVVYVASDCQVGFISNSGELQIHAFPKQIDTVLARVRAEANRAYAARIGGEDVYLKRLLALEEKDVGREKIGPFLKKQLQLVDVEQGDARIFIDESGGADRSYSYGELAYYPYNGRLPMSRCIIALPIPEDTAQVILASDGIAKIKDTVAESLAHLQKLSLHDPLGIHERATTKGFKVATLYPDDIAWVKVSVERAPALSLA